MKTTYLVALIGSVLLFAQCTKESIHPELHAGKYYPEGELYLLDYQDIIDQNPGSMAGWKSDPVIAQETQEVIFKMGSSYTIGENGARHNQFYIDKNPNRIEFAVLRKDTIICGDTLSIAKLFKDEDLINGQGIWRSGDNIIISFYQDGFCGPEISINSNVSGKYLGFSEVRGADTIYGWISIHINNNSEIVLGNYYMHSN